MTNFLRWSLCAVCLLVLAALWMTAAIGALAAGVLGAAAVALVLRLGHSHRRRDSSLRYVELLKAPVSLR